MMQMLLERLNRLRPDIKSFLLTVHELSSEDDPMRTDFREFSGSSPDDPAQACALLYPAGDAVEGALFDPLDYVVSTARQLHGGEQGLNFSLTGPMPSYLADGKEVTRRYECSLAFVDGLDTLPPGAGPLAKEEETPGCC